MFTYKHILGFIMNRSIANDCIPLTLINNYNCHKVIKNMCIQGGLSKQDLSVIHNESDWNTPFIQSNGVSSHNEWDTNDVN